MAAFIIVLVFKYSVCQNSQLLHSTGIQGLSAYRRSQFNAFSRSFFDCSVNSMQLNTICRAVVNLAALIRLDYCHVNAVLVNINSKHITHQPLQIYSRSTLSVRLALSNVHLRLPCQMHSKPSSGIQYSLIRITLFFAISLHQA